VTVLVFQLPAKWENPSHMLDSNDLEMYLPHTSMVLLVLKLSIFVELKRHIVFSLRGVFAAQLEILKH
jgi:hypothetical protein